MRVIVIHGVDAADCAAKLQTAINRNDAEILYIGWSSTLADCVVVVDVGAARV